MKKVYVMIIFMIFIVISGCSKDVLQNNNPDTEVVVSLNKGINYENIDMILKETTQLTIEEEATFDNEDVTWVSEDSNVAIIDDKGIITGVGVGTTTVTGYVTEETQLEVNVKVTYPKVDLEEGIYHIVNSTTEKHINSYASLGEKVPFLIQKQTDGSYLFYWQNVGGNKKLTLENAPELGSEIYLTTTENTNLQSFYIYDTGNGEYVISPVDNPELVIGFTNAPSLELLTNHDNARWNFVPFHTSIIFPVDISNGGWSALTYTSGHNGTDYTAIDINRNSPSYNLDKGVPVRAVQDGEVIRINLHYGQVHVKHTTPLTIKNGVVYHTWYSTYVHMSNIPVKVGDNVKQGQTLGKISDVSVTSVTDHLHFSMTTKLSPNDGADHSEYYNQFTISPIWIGGEYDEISYVRGEDYTTALYTKIVRDIDLAPVGN